MTASHSASSDHRFLYDGWNLIAEYEVTTGNALSLMKNHQWGHDLSNTPQGAGGVGGLLATNIKQSNGSWKSYLPSFDGNGNIISWTSGTGAILQRIDYDPFGNTLTKNGNFPDEKKLTFGFSTKYEDAETGLLYYGYRYYDPKTGRWPSRDPLGDEAFLSAYAANIGHAQKRKLTNESIGNLYALLKNDGLNRWDVLGLYGPMPGAYGDWSDSYLTNVCEASDEEREAAQVLLFISTMATPIPGDEAAVAPAIAARVSKLLKKCKCIRCEKPKIDKAHHPFPIPKFTNSSPYFTIRRCWMKHVQINCYRKGVKGSSFSIKIPFGKCYRNANGEGGLTW